MISTLAQFFSCAQNVQLLAILAKLFHNDCRGNPPVWSCDPLAPAWTAAGIWELLGLKSSRISLSTAIWGDKDVTVSGEDKIILDSPAVR